jgi:hypothetical protein
VRQVQRILRCRETNLYLVGLTISPTISMRVKPMDFDIAETIRLC